MAFLRLQLWVALCALVLLFIAETYSFSTYYPAMRGFQFYRGHWTRFPLKTRAGSIQRPSRTLTETVRSVRSGNIKSTGLETSVEKRLMGLTRCNGWGPSCSNVGYKVSIISFKINYYNSKIP